ncbi:N4-gp56 family major capsid protein [Schaalia cardiffensis]|uniref:N4-gp56 family major capsid protein n=1 Tax=Schaalia cardiffensis TaxID=181487 RepID=UPI0023F36AD7|nr:N4-gp56 family major capsid protein [Schaalia cardiffensis]
MATTLAAALYDPEVWSDLAYEAFKGRAIIGASSAVLTRDDLAGQPGDTITFPKWGNLTDLADLTENVAMVPEALTQTSSKATIKEAGKAVEITDTAQLVGFGNAQDEALRQFGILAARKVDADLIAAATATIVGGIDHKGGSATDSKPFQATATGGLTWANIVDAIAVFGDDFEPTEFTGLFIRSDQRAQIMKDDAFIRASETQAGGPGSLVNRGMIGDIAGVPVFVTNRLADKHAILLKQNSLGLFYKRRPIVERDRDILKRTTVVTTNLHYAVKRVADEGVLDITIA